MLTESQRNKSTFRDKSPSASQNNFEDVRRLINNSLLIDQRKQQRSARSGSKHRQNSVSNDNL